MLQKEREKNAKIESQKEPTFGRWIWRTLKDIGEWIFISEKSKTKIRGYEGEGTIETSQRRYILGPLTPYDYLLGYKGFEVEYTWAKSTVAEVVRNLNEEEWDWVEMKLKEVEALKFREPIYWDPKEDPRPDWRIQEIQNLNQIKNTTRKLGETGTENTRRTIIRETVAQGPRLTCNEPGQNLKPVRETVAQGPRLTCNEPGQNLKPIRETVAQGPRLTSNKPGQNLKIKTEPVKESDLKTPMKAKTQNQQDSH